MKSSAINLGISLGKAEVSLKKNKPLRMILLATAVVLGVGLYWMQLQRLTHVRTATVHHAVHAAATATAGKSLAVAAAPAVVEPALKKTAIETSTALWTYMLNAVKSASTEAAAQPQVAKISSAPVAKPAASHPPTVQTLPKPVVSRPPPMPSAQDQMLLAAQTAFNNVMDLADKYPDSYGFKPTDVLSNAKLGAAIPVCMIAETDRDNYKSGQPIKPSLRPANQWVFPVMMGDRICCMVQVSYVGHNYVPGGGNKTLALAWNKILQKWPASKDFIRNWSSMPMFPASFILPCPSCPTRISPT